MKHRSTTPVSKGIVTKSALVAAAVIFAVSGPISLSLRPSTAYATTYQEYQQQIDALNAEIGQYQQQASQLSEKAKTLENELALLTSQKATIQAQIDVSQKKYDQLKEKIAETEKEIQNNKDALGDTIADMYVDNSISPLEMLASSSDIGGYVDKQEYRNSIQDNLSQAITRINSLKKQLEAQKVEVERVLADQQSQRSSLAAKEAEQQKLVNDTRGEESAYQALSSDRDAKKRDLENKQAATMRSSGNYTNIGPSSGTGGGYPAIWANSPQDSLVDNWGLYNRECVSYTAWKVASTGRYVPHFSGAGNANQWPSTTARHGIANGSTPKAGSVAIDMSGYYGHAMYVEAVNSDGTITVSDYNNNADGLGWGRYHYYSRSSAGLIYIYF